jgi:cytochrome P450
VYSRERRGARTRHNLKHKPSTRQQLAALLQRENKAALQLINTTLTSLIAESKALLDAENIAFDEDTFLSTADPSILHFLIAAGDEITSKQLRDDLMTMLIAGHETTAAVLTWTTHLLAGHPAVLAALQAEARAPLWPHARSAAGAPPQRRWPPPTRACLFVTFLPSGSVIV